MAASTSYATDDHAFNIAVMGVTGAGKSTFIKAATGLDVPIGHALEPKTQEVTAYPFLFEGVKFVLIDTPGFNDTNKSDTDILRELAAWLSTSYHHGVRLAGIIYMHRIMDARMTSGAMKNFALFKKLLGSEPLHRLVLLTSCWDMLPLSTGEASERELRERGTNDLWGGLVQRGARMARFSGDRESALAVLKVFLGLGSQGVVLDIQRELVDERKTLKDTAAGLYLDAQFQSREVKIQNEFERHTGEHAHRDLPVLTRGEYGSADSAGNIGSLDDLNMSWNPDYGSLWLNEEGNAPPDIDPLVYIQLRRGHFRLVVLRAGGRNIPLEISLTVARLVDPPPYSALSYAVGHDQRQIPIKLRHKRTLNDIQIGENLHTALIHLRRKSHDIMLWIDALSINQNDNAERVSQIQHMTDIFAKAENVCIWLGSATEGPQPIISHDMDVSQSNHVAMKLAAEVLDLKNFDAAMRSNDRRAEFFCLTRLLASDWFSRRWCVQEVLMAKHATVHCGEHVMPWSDFVDVAQLLSPRWSEVQASMDRLLKQKVGHAQSIGALALINVSASILRRTGNKEIVERLMDLESLLKVLGMFEVTVSLDAIYSIYNLAKDLVGTDKLRIDYTLPPRELFTDVTELIVRSSGSLDIICYPWAPPAPLPSWIPTTSRLPYRRRRGGFQYDRQHGSPFVNLPDPIRRYHACGDTTAEGNVRFERGTKPVLWATGRLSGVVTELGGQSLNGLIPSDWLRLCGWHDTQQEKAPEAFWQSIVADQGTTSLRAPRWYRRACETAVRESVTDYIDTDLLRSDPAASSHVKEYLEKVQDVIWSRSLVKVNYTSFERDTVCLCPRETRINDFICILYGCSIPVVLRPQGEKYEMVGECFVYGHIDGEAFSSTHDLGLKEMGFQII